MIFGEWHLATLAAKVLITEEYRPIGVYAFSGKISSALTHFPAN
jgi:hypothetical protein